MFGFGEGVTFSAANDIPNLAEKVVLVTGGNTGLGKESIIQLAKHNPARIYLAARTRSKAESAIKDITAEVPGSSITFLQLDLASLQSVKEAADSFLSSTDRLDILVCNAGVMAQPDTLTPDGYEIQFGTNHMGHALLTKLLLPTLRNTAKQPGSDVRVIVLSSAAHSLAPKAGIDFSSLTTKMSDYSTWTRYGQSKAANVLFASELARRYPEIMSVSCHPGVIKTDLSAAYKSNNRLVGIVFAILSPFMEKTVAEGAKNQLWCATSTGPISGEFYYPVGAKNTGRGFPENKELARELWEWTDAELVKKGYT